MKSWFLYSISNKLNGKMYIGISSRPEKRKNQHFFAKKSGTRSKIKNAIDKYGHENFEFKILVEGSKSYIADLEVKAISLYKTRKQEFGYNLKPGGETGAGYTMPFTTKDKFQFVSGFWFPNVRTALIKIGIDKSTLLRRRKEGVLGEVVQSNLKKDWKHVPVYLGGYWWPDIFVASKNLNSSIEALKNRIKKNSVEQSFNVRDQSGDKNHMSGLEQKDYSASKAVIVMNVRYDSIKQATEHTGLSKYIINQRIKQSVEGFSFSQN